MKATVAGTGLVLSDNPGLRLISFFIFYLGQSMPLGLSVIALPAWLAANGAPDADVAAIIATAYLPWSFKFIPAALMDRYTYLPMGRRRLWLILSSALMIAGFMVAAALAPGVDDIQALVAITFLIGASAAIQDVAVDGLAVDILTVRDQGPASSFMFGGQTLGIACTGAAAGYLLFAHGSQVAFLCFLPVIACLAIYAIAILERPGEKRLPWTQGGPSALNLERQVEAWLPIVTLTFKSMLKRDSIVQIVSSASMRTAGGIMSPLFPILATKFVGFNEASYSGMTSVVGIGVALAGITLGSFLTLRFGPKRSAIGVYFVLAAVSLFVMGAQDFWLVTGIFITLYSVSELGHMLTNVCSNPLRMQLTDPRVASTQFTIYNSFYNLPVSLGATLFAMLGGTKALTLVMLTAAGLFVAGALVLTLIRIGGPPAKAAPRPEMD